SLANLGQILRHQGDLDRALSLYRESLARFEAQGDTWGIAYAGNNLAVLLREQGEHDRAVELAARSVRLLWGQGDNYYLLFALGAVARALLGAGRAEAAVRLFAAAQALRASSGAVLSPGGREDYDRHVAEARAALGEGGFAAAWSAGETLPTEQAIATAL